MGDDMRSRSELLLNQTTDFIHTFQPMEGCQSCLCFLASLLTPLWKLFSGILFPVHLFSITTSLPYFLIFSATSRGHQQPFPFLCFRASCCKSRSQLSSGAYDTSISSLSRCSVGVPFLRWTGQAFCWTQRRDGEMGTHHSKTLKSIMKLQTQSQGRELNI